MSSVVNVRNSPITINITDANETINVNDDVSLNVQNVISDVNIVDEVITLNIESGGVLAANSEVTVVAGQILSALRGVTLNNLGQAVYADSSSVASATLLGLTSTAANLGSFVNVKTHGLVTDLSWSWNKGPIFITTNGGLTQTAPSNGAIIAQIGRALSSTTLFVDVDPILITV